MMKLVLESPESVYFDLKDGENSIGRVDPVVGAYPSIDLQKYDSKDQISRMHAMIVVNQDKWIIKDLGSRNGTYINRGPRLAISREYILEEGDEIIIGKLFFRISN